MSPGEGVGVLGMKSMEYLESGFLFRLPKDLYFLIASMALCLILIPVWSDDLWYLSCAFMVLLLAFGNTCIPVVAESIHRLSVLNDKPPSRVFSEARFIRLLACALMGILVSLMY